MVFFFLASKLARKVGLFAGKFGLKVHLERLCVHPCEHSDTLLSVDSRGRAARAQLGT